MRARAGFSLVETTVALVMLAVVTVSAQAMAARMIRTVSTANIQLTASKLVDDRIDAIRMDPQYTQLVARYTATENPVAGYPTYSRQTVLVRTNVVTTAGATDYITVTVLVAEPGLTTPVSRTIVIGSP